MAGSENPIGIHTVTALLYSYLSVKLDIANNKGTSQKPFFYLYTERPYGVVVKVAQLWCRKSLKGCKFEAGLHNPISGNPTVNGYLFSIRQGRMDV